jgi:hypothetical protein
MGRSVASRRKQETLRCVALRGVEMRRVERRCAALRGGAGRGGGNQIVAAGDVALR